MQLLKITLIIISFFLIGCHASKKNSCGQVRGENLIVFIGSKISVEEVKYEISLDMWDYKFKAKYEVVEVVCGNYKKDTIEFIGFDHYGEPAFSEFDTVMLYVSKGKNGYYHRKYQYHDVYRTIDGRWASPYDTLAYWRLDSSIAIRPEKLNFARQVGFDITNQKRQWVKRQFPVPFFEITPDKAIPIYGNYIPELFEMTKQTTLSYIFKKPLASRLKIKEIELAIDTADSYEQPVPKAIPTELFDVWEKLITSIANQDNESIRIITLDSIPCSVCEGFSETYYYNDTEPVDSFIVSAYRYFPNTTLWQQMRNAPDFTVEKGYGGSDVLYCNKVLAREENTTTISEIAHVFKFKKYGSIYKLASMESQLERSWDKESQ